MNQLTLVLPFALPPPELASDLVRSLQAPALAALLSRTALDRQTRFDDDARALPHESWLARFLGLDDARPAFAAAAMRGFGLDPGNDTWLIVHPAHIEIARSHLAMHDLRKLHLADDHARALFDCAAPLFDELGHTLQYGDAQTWFMRAAGWADLETSTPDSTLGMNLGDAMPSGDQAKAYRRLQNEVQMLWFAHPANAAREARGQAPVNAFWPWGAASVANAAAPFAVTDAPAWLRAVAGTVLAHPGAILDNGADSTLVCGGLIGPGLAGEWAAWIDAVHRLESALFAPTVAALAAGRVKSVRLVLNHRTALLDLTTTPMAQRKFWRRINLDRLL